MAAFWKAAGELKLPFGELFRVLALTGGRLREISEARWSEVDFDKKLLMLAPERIKTDEPHLIPLTDSVIAILKGIESGGGWARSVHNLRQAAGFGLQQSEAARR